MSRPRLAGSLFLRSASFRFDAKGLYIAAVMSAQKDDNHEKHTALLVTRFTQHPNTISNQQYEDFDAMSVDYKSVICGLASGVLQAGLFMPYDRALYLSMTNRRPFLSVENFRNPFIGFTQSIGGRALAGGLYFPLEQFFFRAFHDGDKTKNNGLTNFAAGTAAGAVNAMLLNPLSAVKYKTWSRVHNRGVVYEAFSMFKKGGRAVFFKGLTPTLLRDITFGGCYTSIRLQAQWSCDIDPDHQWIANLVAAALATVASGPFNLARNLQYNTKSAHRAPAVTEVLMQLLNEVRQIGNTHQKLLHLQSRLRIGWGTARVAMGMSFGHWVYDVLHAMVH